jgi:hypothetical protein
MGWATHYILKLKKGETVQFRPRGNSMKPRIESGQLVTVVPLADHVVLKPGDIVLCKVYGHEYLHLIHAVLREGEVWTIANARGRVNGTAGRGRIYGVCTKIE